jgi:hypothetical protein
MHHIVPLVIVLSINKSGKAHLKFPGRPCIPGKKTSGKRSDRNKERISLYTTLAILLKEILQHVVVQTGGNRDKPFNIQGNYMNKKNGALKQ